MTLVVNGGGGWLIAWITRLPLRYGLGIGLILQNRGEFRSSSPLSRLGRPRPAASRRSPASTCS